MTDSTATETPSPLLRTSLYDVHVASKARLVPFAGWEMPVQYAGVIPEVKAVRENVGIFDVSHMGRVVVTGPDALSYLQSLTVNNVAKLPEAGGMGQYSLLCNALGGVIDDIIVYRRGPEDFLVVVNAANAPKVVPYMLQKAQSLSVTVSEITPGQALLAVQGPKAVALVSGLADSDLSALPRFGISDATIAGVKVIVGRTGYTGEDGFELFCDAADATTLWNALVGAGAVPCGLGARDTLRVEAALPLYGHEMDENTSPYAARLGWVIKLDKGAFVGSDVISAAKSTQKQKLVGLAMETRGIPREGYPVDSGGRNVGFVTSGTFSPILGKGIALARVASDAAAVGTEVTVSIRGTDHQARVVPLPFYKKPEATTAGL